ncbi:hypothetical protein BT96DRAFT_413929 [Gymnopus androsaceus JB14]|uniref:F-box domain-containing protein n=1 Tax=Gymnopus androsaceus JB14 TaxID=1447944 RepID=A0A6A4GTB0_9AGAR|nr:hypothetical protein BT96DRAFT_413929 [Gymnopus androsaceus JB14]
MGRRFCYPFADLSCFQRRSATALSSLTLQNFSAQDDQLFTEELTAALSLLPEIKALHIERFSLNIDPLLQALTYTKDHRDLLPNLTTLTLQPDQFCNDNAIYPKELAAMILSRWWPDMDESVDIDSQLAFDRSGLQRLQKVTLRGYRNAPVEIASVCGLTGLDVEFCNYEGSAYA